MHGGSRGGSYNGNLFRKTGNRLFVFFIEVAFLAQFFIELLECKLKLSDSFGEYIVDIELILSVLG